MRLNISSRSKAMASDDAPGAWAAATRSRINRARAFRWSSNTRKENAAIETVTKRMRGINNISLRLDLRPGLKQLRPQGISCRRQSLCKTRLGSGGAKYTMHFAGFVDSATVEGEDVLHPDTVAF